MCFNKEFPVEIDSDDLQLDAAEALLHLFLYLFQHVLIIAHPDQSVNGDARLPPREGRVVMPPTTLFIMTHGHFQSEKDGWVMAQRFGVNISLLFQIEASLG
mgnify:CR=1 FL=1